MVCKNLFVNGVFPPTPGKQAQLTQNQLSPRLSLVTKGCQIEVAQCKRLHLDSLNLFGRILLPLPPPAARSAALPLHTCPTTGS